jgi:protein-S-isoprenylcysteine O-methyltransferase Ste14
MIVEGRSRAALLHGSAKSSLIHRLPPGGRGVIRHPSYLGLLVNSLGWSLAFRSSVGVLLTALPALFARIRAEEALLRSEFGEVYDAYVRRTRGLLRGLY